MAVLDKIDVWPIVREHFRTLYDNRRGRPSRGDRVVALALPAAIATVPLWSGVTLPASSGLLTTAAMLGGFLFAVLILVLQQASSVAETTESEGLTSRSLRRVKMLRELRGNVSYSVLLCVVTAAWLSLGEFSSSWAGKHPFGWDTMPTPSTLFAVLALFLLSHLGVTLLMVLRRLFLLIGVELDLASVPKGRE